MQVASRPYALAAAALVATGAVAVTPIAARQLHLPSFSMDTRLVVDGDSLLNVPLNLFYDIANIPANEIAGIDNAAGSLMFTGEWWTPSATNIWGIDPGDSTHIAALDGLFLPFPSLDEGVGGLDYQLAGLLAAELPVSAGCDAASCYPITPPNVITGITALDRDIGYFQSLFGLNGSGSLLGGADSGHASDMFSTWFRVGLGELIKGYTFDNPGSVDPSGPAYPGFGFDGSTGNPFEGGTGPGDTMPWAGLDFKLNLFQPVENFMQSLMAAPPTDGTGIEVPTFEGLYNSLQALAAGLVIDFDPYTPGSPACVAECLLPDSMTVEGIVKGINSLSITPGGNPMINEWLTAFEAGQANMPTELQADESIAMLQTGFFNLSPDQLANVDGMLANINPELPALLTNAGVLTDPGYLDFSILAAQGTDTLADWAPVYGGYDPGLIVNDLLQMVGLNGLAAEMPNGLGAAAGMLDPMTWIDSMGLLAQALGI